MGATGSRFPPTGHNDVHEGHRPLDRYNSDTDASTATSSASSSFLPSASAPSSATASESPTATSRSTNEADSDDNGEMLIDNSSDSKGWGIVEKLGKWGLIRRRVGADVYDDEKANDQRNFNNNVLQSGPQNKVNIRFPDGLTPLTSAIRSSNIDAVDAFLQHPGIDVNFPEWQQYSLYSFIEVSPLTVAVKMNDSETVKKLLDKGADIDGTDSNKETALYVACESGYHDIVSFLLEAGSKMTSSPFVYDPLHAACRGGHFECVKLLVEAGCNVNPTKQQDDLRQPLDLSITQRHDDISLYLLEKGAWIHEPFSPLVTACSHRCPKVVQYLINTGFDVNHHQCSELPALMQALKPGDLHIVRRLMSLSPDKLSSEWVDITEQYRTVLSESTHVIKLLCEANSNITSTYGMSLLSPLSFALQSGNLPVAIVLLKHGAPWTPECDSAFTKYDLTRIQQIYPDIFMCLLSLLDFRRSKMYRKYTQKKSVPTLRSCSRRTIRNTISRRRNLSTSIIPSINNLPLPPLLKDYLAFCDIDERKLIESIPLEMSKLVQ